MAYVRRSTDKQEQSIADQQRAIERFCEEQGIPLLRWHIEDAISGTRTANRPALQEMIAAAADPSGCDFSSGRRTAHLPPGMLTEHACTPLTPLGPWKVGDDSLLQRAHRLISGNDLRNRFLTCAAEQAIPQIWGTSEIEFGYDNRRPSIRIAGHQTDREFQ